jgi:hypothetical protein
MSADMLLSMLHGVRRTGANRWLGLCPAHVDKRPSLSVRELDDGRVLLHCFAGCAAREVIAAAGLEMADLFPPRPLGHAVKGERRPVPSGDVLRAVEREALIVAIAAATLGSGGALTDIDRARLVIASQRLSAAVMESGHALR